MATFIVEVYWNKVAYVTIEVPDGTTTTEEARELYEQGKATELFTTYHDESDYIGDVYPEEG